MAIARSRKAVTRNIDAVNPSNWFSTSNQILELGLIVAEYQALTELGSGQLLLVCIIFVLQWGDDDMHQLRHIDIWTFIILSFHE